jgi:thiol-disulfide isomerase/thioredoxin
MKQYSLLLWVLCVCLTAQAQQRLQLTPAQPQPGATITITYNPKGTPLANAEEIEAIAYLMEGKFPIAREIALRAGNGVYTGTVATNDSTRALFFTFLQGHQYDNNNDSGYYTLLYNQSGAPVPGAYLAAANAFTGIGGIWNLPRNQPIANRLFQTGFAIPGAKETFKGEYWNYLSQSGNEADKATLQQELQAAAGNPQTTEADLIKVHQQYLYNLKDKEKADAVTASLKERFPTGKWQRDDLQTAIYEERNYAKRKELFTRLQALGTPTKEEPFLDHAATMLARQAADSGDYAAMETYIAFIQDPMTKAIPYNDAAWKLSGEGINNKPLDPNRGKELAQKALALIEGEKKALAYKPAYRTPKQWQYELQQATGMFSDTYAANLYHAGDFEKAYAVQREAAEAYEWKDAPVNAVYTQIMEKVKGPQATQAELERLIANNHYTADMKEQLKKIYLANNSHTAAQWNTYWGALEQKALAIVKAAVAKKMINQPAPGFKLKDLKGQEVSLASLKGKVVVVDFWATWCGPCLASFPGMQRVVEKYKSNPNVVFLFVNTWEGGPDRQKKVTDLMTKNKYTFRVLYDQTKPGSEDEFTIVSNYNVEGIPTKFIIDGNNNIRFKSMGGGSGESQLSELDVMIELAAANNAPAKKAL